MVAAVQTMVGSLARGVLDFALPPRCAGCGEIVDALDRFCVPCWSSIDWLGDNGCDHCGIPLQATEAEWCGRCLADPPKLDRIRSAVVYDDLTRSMVLRLKYGRKVALARAMGRYLAPLLSGEQDVILIPVPLHRSRLWGRGFNQSVLLARAIAKGRGLPVETGRLKRTRRTVALKGMNIRQRQDAVRGAFAVSGRFSGETIVLVDDVFTTGSTAEACARALRKAGAGRVELICWARVVRPAHVR